MQKPIANVFTWPADDPQLLGGKCDRCGTVTFPVQARCPRCGSQGMAELPLPRHPRVLDDAGVPADRRLPG
jgi:uncharacterized OB-fold protein